MEEDGLMRVDGGKAIVPSVIQAVETARELGILVVWVIHSLFFSSLNSLSVLIFLVPRSFPRKIDCIL